VANEIVSLQLAMRLQELKAIRVWNTILGPNATTMLVDFIVSRKELKNIDLVGVSIPKSEDAQIPRMAMYMQNIVQLSLDHTDVSRVANQIFQAFSENTVTSLITLSMRYCNLHSTCAKSLSNYLSKTSSLMNLYLGGNKLRDESLSSLAKVTENHPSLKQLDLAFNEVEDRIVQGESPFHLLCQSVGTNRQIVRLNVSGNFFEQDGFQAVVDALESRKQLVDAGVAPPLQIDVPERIDNEIFEKVIQLNALLQGKSKKGKKK
jgi:Ran GTPase-activating protein (RanGAP) involved in mRNA processing and transport